MDATTIDQEFQQLQAEFQDVAGTVQALAAKLQTAEKAGDANATEWLADLKKVAQDIDDEQAQVKTLLLAIHEFIGNAAEDKPPLFAPGQEPQQTSQQPVQQRHGMLGGMLGGGMLGGGMLGGYYGGGFGRAMEMGMAMNLGANLMGSVFRL